MTLTHGTTAVVIGASIAGLLAARALSDYYEKVVVLDRDRLPDDPVARSGVPHMRHSHAPAGQGPRGHGGPAPRDSPRSWSAQGALAARRAGGAVPSTWAAVRSPRLAAACSRWG